MKPTKALLHAQHNASTENVRAAWNACTPRAFLFGRLIVSVLKNAHVQRVHRQNLANSGTEGKTYKCREPGAEKAKKESKRV